MEPGASHGDTTAERSRALLDAWERGLGETPGERALTLLESASPRGHRPPHAACRRAGPAAAGTAARAVRRGDRRRRYVCALRRDDRARVRRRRGSRGRLGRARGGRGRDGPRGAHRPTSDGCGRRVAPGRSGRGTAGPALRDRRAARARLVRGRDPKRRSRARERRPAGGHLIRPHLPGVRDRFQRALRHRCIRVERGCRLGGAAAERRSRARRRLRLERGGDACSLTRCGAASTWRR